MNIEINDFFRNGSTLIVMGFAESGEKRKYFVSDFDTLNREFYNQIWFKTEDEASDQYLEEMLRTKLEIAAV